MTNENETVEQICELMTGWENHTWMCSSDHEYIGELAKRILDAHNREVAELNRKIADYELMLASSPIGLIYQLGICNQDGDVMNGIGLLFTNEAERAKMPRIGHGDKFYVVPMELAHKVKGVVA